MKTPSTFTPPLIDSSAVGYFVPDKLQDSDPIDELRARVLILAMMCPAGIGLFFTLLYLFILDQPRLMAGTGTVTVLSVAGLFILRSTGSIAATGQWIAFVLIGALFWLSAHGGGIEAAAVPWMILVPIFATFFAGFRAGLVWGAAAVGAVLALYLLEANDVFVRQLLDPEGAQLIRVLGSSGLILVTFLFFWLNHQLESWLTERLNRSTSELTAILDTAPNAILTIDESGDIQGANRVAKKMFGRSEDALLETPLTDIVPTLHRQRDGRSTPVSISGSMSMEPADHQGVGPDGEEFPVSLSISSFAGPPADRAVVVIRDETEVREMRARMMQTDRLSAVGTLASGLGHEINNPLSYIKGNLDYLHRSIDTLVDEDPETDTDLEDLREAVEDGLHGLDRIAAIVSDLQQFSTSPDDQDLGAVDVEEVLESSIAIARNEIRHRATLHRDYEDVPPALAEIEGLGQVFLNLLLNAAEAMPEGRAEDNELEVAIELDDDYVVTSVSDTGHGIEEQDLDRIFDPFFTTRDPDQGTGLGLAMSQKTIQQMGGFISVDSRPGEGSTFTVRLPVAPLNLPESFDDGSVGAELPDLPIDELMIVEDEPRVCRALQRRLDRRIETVDCYTDPTEGLDALLEGANYDVILLDLLMPRLDGRQFYETLEQHRPELLDRIVILSGGAFTPDSRRFLDEQDLPYLQKPLEPGELQEVLEQLVDKTVPSSEN